MVVTVTQPIVIAGCGPGNPEYITPAVRKAVADAHLLVAARRIRDLFPESTAEYLPVGSDIESTLREIACSAHRRIVVAVSGDPGISSLAALVIARFGRERCTVLPGISSVQVACARLGHDWTGMRIITAHARTPAVNVAACREDRLIAILAGSREAMRWVADFSAKLHGHWQACICEELTLPQERISIVPIERLGTVGTSPRTVVILTREENHS